MRAPALLLACALASLPGCVAVTDTAVHAAGTAERARGATRLVAVFPVENLSGKPAPLDDVRRLLVERLTASGFGVLADAALERVAARHRVRYMAGVEAEFARALGQEAGVEAIVMTASGCGVHVKEYGYYLRNDPAYAAKAERVAAAVRDIAEILRNENLAKLKPSAPAKIAFQSPCTLQHGQKLGGVVEEILQKVGFALTAVPDGHLCCGSAGTYSILHPILSRRLRRNKLDALTQNRPNVIATANIGCLTHLQAGTDLPVRHWIELLAD